MTDREKKIIFCCAYGIDRSTHCATEASEKGLSADRLKEGWRSLVVGVKPEVARERLIQEHSQDHLIIISNDIPANHLQNLIKILETVDLSFEFLEIVEVLRIVHHKRLPSYLMKSSDSQ